MAAQPELQEVQWKPRAAGRDKKRLPARVSALFLNRSREPLKRTMRSLNGGTARRDDAPGLRARNFRTAAMIRKIVGFTRDGFRGMTVGRTLWCIKAVSCCCSACCAPFLPGEIRMAGRSVAEWHSGGAGERLTTDVENPLSDP